MTQPPAHFDLPELRGFGPSPARSYPPPRSTTLLHLPSATYRRLSRRFPFIYIWAITHQGTSVTSHNSSSSHRISIRIFLLLGTFNPGSACRRHVKRSRATITAAYGVPHAHLAPLLRLPRTARALARSRSFATGHSFIFSSTVRVAVAASGVRARVFSVFRLPYISSLHHSAVDINHPRL